MRVLAALVAAALLAATAAAQAAVPPFSTWPPVQNVAAYPQYKEGEVRGRFHSEPQY